ncbi:pyrroline-5-carboxylate reductase [Paenalcaligenes niemegkensis]|uniref:pyrroline-5-carboxylate reductase n=1 Tax=Paenalcaligenes niemegkensis TaxID=2895469 RepID=UPI001EE89E82|nr:pyrroline-5-carboxylate reductase [Paenalcaligenes niemegkensis]MCQ9616334.1 pyrroline-5-carboxylate reductase [Paenalcaligenes niemegkensis]
MINEKYKLTLAFIGGGNMATALSAGLIRKRCAAEDVLVIDPNESVRATWTEQGTFTAGEPDAQLSGHRVWLFAVKPQAMKNAVLACRPFLQSDTVIISVAAGIAATDIARWLGEPDQPCNRVIRCMPNTPAFIGCGATGLMALPAVHDDDKKLAEQLLGTVGETVWVDSDEQIDAVTALSGSGPAYVFLFLEALIQGGIEQGLSSQQARKLALATLNGATQLAGLSPESPATLRERVTSEGGTTAAALQVFEQQQFHATVRAAMAAAKHRAAQLAAEFS